MTTDTESPVELLSVEQAARRVGIANSTMRKRIASGKIAYHRDGRRVLIHVDDLARYMAARRVPARRAS